MNSEILHKGIDVLDHFYPSINTAFITDSIWNEKGKYIQITILHDTFDYQTFESFVFEDIIVEILVFPKPYLALVDRNFDFLNKHNFIESISNGFLIKDNLNWGEKLQQMFEVTGNSFNFLGLPLNLKEFFVELSRLLNLFELSITRPQNFILKNRIFCKINEILSFRGFKDIYNSRIESLEKNFSDDIAFLNATKIIQAELGANVRYYSDKETYNLPVTQNKISILISTESSLDDFILFFLLPLLEKLKTIAHKIQFSFKLFDENKFLINIWTDHIIIKETIIPTLDYIFSANFDLYQKFSPRYPFSDKSNEIRSLILPQEKIKKLQVLISSYLLDLKLNEKTTLTEGFIISYGIYITIELLLIQNLDKKEAKKISNYLFENWMALSYNTKQTNFNNLEIQSHIILNEFENLYLSQSDMLESNYGEIIKKWVFSEESILGLETLIRSFYNQENNSLELLKILSTGSQNKKNEIIIENIVFETLSSLGINNYYKSYIIYSINRLLHGS